MFQIADDGEDVDVSGRGFDAKMMGRKQKMQSSNSLNSFPNPVKATTNSNAAASKNADTRTNV
jgi:hypothetical protein